MQLVSSLDDPGVSHDPAETPWDDGGPRLVRRTLLNIISETAQHAGRADVIRQSPDGQKTMG